MAEYAPVDLSTENQVTFELNGVTVSAPAGTMLVDACYAHGVEVPIFCYEPRIGPPIGACRMCLVEIEGMRGLQTACSTPVQQDMVVRTNSPAAVDAQDGVLEVLLANHPLDCPVCDKGGECPLQDRTFRFGPGRTRFIENKRHFPKPLNLSSRIALDRERCIHCYRCVRYSQDVAQDGQLTMQERGARSEITTFTGDPYEGRFTGNVVDICPVGALTSIPYRFVSRPWDVKNTPTVCGLCPVGCNTEMTLREGEVKRVTARPEPNFAVEEGWLCDTGRWGYDISGSDDRLLAGVVRDVHGERTTDLEDAVAAAVAVLGASGRPVGILLGPSATVEEGVVALDLAAGALAGARVARIGVPGDALGALRALPGAQLGDLDHADLVVVVGGDPAAQQPVTELRVRKAARFGAAVATAGPRPHVLESLGTSVRTAPGDLVEGVEALAERIAAATRPVVLWDEADLAAEPDAAAALARVVAANGGARQIELSADVAGPGLRALGIPAVGLLEAVQAGEVGALLLIHADPFEAAGAAAWSAAVTEADIPVVAIATHATAAVRRADVVLPAHTMWEQEGTLVSMTGRAQRLRQGGHGPDGAAAAWEILVALAHRLGAPPVYRTPAGIMKRAGVTLPALAGVDYDAIGVLGTVIPAPQAPADAPAGRREPAGAGVALVATAEVYGGPVARRSLALEATRRVATIRLAAETAAALGLADGAVATVTSPHGAATLPVHVDDRVSADVALVPLGAEGAPAEHLLPADRGAVRVTITPEDRA